MAAPRSAIVKVATHAKPAEVTCSRLAQDHETAVAGTRHPGEFAVPAARHRRKATIHEKMLRLIVSMAF